MPMTMDPDKMFGPMTMDPDEMFGQEPLQLRCSNCHQVITTRVESNVRSEAWIFASFCCLFGSWLTSLLVKSKINDHN